MQRSSTRVVIVEDHSIVREALRTLLSERDDLHVVGTVADGGEAVSACGSLEADLVTMDLSMPGVSGLDATRQLKERYPHVKVIVLTVHKSIEYIKACFEAGADGYVPKEADPEELFAAIDQVLRGAVYLSSDLTAAVVRATLSNRGKPAGGSGLGSLTERERQVLKLVAEGRTSRQIASYLCISEKTVEKHRSRMGGKLGLHSVAALVAFALQNGIVDLLVF